MSYRFNVDRLVEKNGKLLISSKDRHFLIKGLDESTVEQFVGSFKNDYAIKKIDLPQSIFKTLIENELLISEDRNSVGNLIGKNSKKETLLFIVAKALRYLGSVPSLSILALTSIGLYYFYGSKFKTTFVSDLILTASLSQFLITIVTILLSFFVHELGHAAAAFYYTGTVGKINMRFIWGLPAIVIDVSSYCLTHKVGKAAISLAGIIFQIFTCSLVIALVDNSSIQIGAKIGILIGLVNLLPLPQYDGYWLLVDLFGRKFSPQLIKCDSYFNKLYGAALLLLFLVSAPFSFYAIAMQMVFSIDIIKAENIRGWILFFFSSFAFVSSIIFAFTLFKTLFPLRIFLKNHEYYKI